MDSSIKDFPLLDRQEFSEACHHLDRRYCHATLGPLRRRWRLRLCTALDTVFSVDGGYTTYIQVTRPLEPMGDDDSLSLDMGSISISGQGHQDATVEADQDMVDAEELDSVQRLVFLFHYLPRLLYPEWPDSSQAAIIKHLPGRDAEHVTYEIHLHPTYQVPCLWFTLHNLPADEPAFNIDTVFRRLVPDEYKDGLRGLGAIGGISADHHPVTGVPAFFVHPCLVGEALSRFECSRENYLIIWLGLVGGCVGLWVPKEMVVQ